MAFVLHGVIISFLGPVKVPFTVSELILSASPNNHCSFSQFSWLIVSLVATANTWFVPLKNEIMGRYFGYFYIVANLGVYYFKSCSICSANSVPIRSWASRVAAPICGLNEI